MSSKILRGEAVAIDCPYPICGDVPAHVRLASPGDVLVSYRMTATEALQLVPRVLTLGVGCRRGTGLEALEEAFAAFRAERGICPEAIEGAASIDLKRNEEGLLRFCKAHGLPLQFYSADELRLAPGGFTASPFVESVTGVDNVCERAAVLGAGGKRIEKKFARAGVTLALAQRDIIYNWSFEDG